MGVAVATPLATVMVVLASTATSLTCVPCVVFDPATATHTRLGRMFSPALSRPRLYPYSPSQAGRLACTVDPAKVMVPLAATGLGVP